MPGALATARWQQDDAANDIKRNLREAVSDSCILSNQVCKDVFPHSRKSNFKEAALTFAISLIDLCRVYGVADHAAQLLGVLLRDTGMCWQGDHGTH